MGKDLPELLTVLQAAEFLGVQRTFAYDQVNRYFDTDGADGWPAVRIGNRLRVLRDGLIKRIMRSTVVVRDQLEGTSGDGDVRPGRNRRRLTVQRGDRAQGAARRRRPEPPPDQLKLFPEG